MFKSILLALALSLTATSALACTDGLHGNGEETILVRVDGLLEEVPASTTFIRVDGLPVPIEEFEVLHKYENPAEAVANLFAN